MILEKIVLQNFRSYEKREFELGEKTVVVGENGSGKSNLVEAIYLLATGKSFRAERDNEMVRHGEEFSIINSQFSNNNQTTNLQVTITDRKKFEVNGVPRRQIDFVGKFRAVLFAPQDLELITGSPGGRRRYLDFVISQVDREYHRSLISYEKGLRQRNKLLEMIREGLANRSQLFFWDKLLIKNGNYLTAKRREYLSSLSGDYTVRYDASIISETRLKRYEVEEVAAAVTLVGPHRDDFVVQILNSKFEDPKDVSKYGSRGEQRMAVLWLKSGEIKYLGEQPLLLLDDIFSELDRKHRQDVAKMVSDHSAAGGQVIVTATDPHLLPNLEGNLIRLG